MYSTEGGIFEEVAEHTPHFFHRRNSIPVDFKVFKQEQLLLI
jgi:hypothetical protein